MLKMGPDLVLDSDVGQVAPRILSTIPLCSKLSFSPGCHEEVCPPSPKTPTLAVNVTF